MPAHKVTFEFEGSILQQASPGGVITQNSTLGTKSGWSESWYFQADQTEAEASSSALALSYWRKQILTVGWQITGIRLSRLDESSNLQRRGTLLQLGPTQGVGTFPASAGFSVDDQNEQPYDALCVSVNSVNGRRRNFLMRGIPNSIVSAGGRFIGAGPWFPRFNGWAGGIQFGNDTPAGDFGTPASLRIRTLRTFAGLIGGNRTIVAAAISGAALGGLVPSVISPVITYTPPDGILVGDTVVIQRTTGISRLNGSWIIQQLAIVGSTTYMQLAARRRVVLSGTLADTGFFRAYGYTLEGITSMFPAFGTSRRTGRPLQLPRGRRSNRTF
jgi:hypothetical protein